MKNTLKVKTAGVGSQQDSGAPPDVVLGPEDGPVVYSQESDATPPDIIVEN